MVKGHPSYRECSMSSKKEPELTALMSSKEVAIINLEDLANLSGLKVEELEAKISVLTNPTEATVIAPAKSKDESSLKKGALDQSF